MNGWKFLKIKSLTVQFLSTELNNAEFYLKFQ